MFGFFSLVLTHVHPLVFGVTMGLSLMEFLVSSYVYKYNYRHREELSHIEKQMWYLTRKHQDLSSLMEGLHYEEPFRFAGGREIPQDDTYEIRLENVSFTYPKSDEKIIDGMNLMVKKGEKVAVFRHFKIMDITVAWPDTHLSREVYLDGALLSGGRLPRFLRQPSLRSLAA